MLTKLRNFKTIGALCSMGQNLDGVMLGVPKIISKMKDVGMKEHLYNLSYTRRFDKKKDYIELNRMVVDSLNKNKKTMVLGGDHSISGATIPAFFDKYRDTGHLIWFDAHGDINTDESTLTGNTHGMPVSKIFGNMDSDVFRSYIPSFNQITYLGLRDLDMYEKNVINENMINSYSTQDIINTNLENILDEIIPLIYDKNVYISFDVDCLDPKEMKCTGTPVDKGLTIETVCNIVDEIKNNSHIPCFDIVEFNPDLGTTSDVERCLNNIIKFIRTIV